MQRLTKLGGFVFLGINPAQKFLKELVNDIAIGVCIRRERKKHWYMVPPRLKPTTSCKLHKPFTTNTHLVAPLKEKQNLIILFRFKNQTKLPQILAQAGHTYKECKVKTKQCAVSIKSFI